LSLGGIDAAWTQDARDLRIGIVGLDTSHVIAFTQILNDPKHAEHVPGARVVAAYKGGSPDVESSATRLEKFTSELREKWGVEIVADIPALCARVDAVLLESVDGRKHLEQLRPILAARKPVFIDKPLAGSLAEAKEIVRLVQESGVPCFSASSLRFWSGVASLRRSDAVGEVLGCDAYSPCSIEPHHPDLYWYGVHGVEILFTLMGPGCEEVWRAQTKDYELVVGRWKDGRIGTFRGLRAGAQTYGATVFGSKAVRSTEPVRGSLYGPLVQEIVKFFRSGKAPVPLDETLEMFAFMSAADESKRRGGSPVKLAELIEGSEK
jgi:predicted dehydrogenase